MTTVALSIGLTEPVGEWRTLVNSIRAWMNRSDLSDTQVTEFIALAEARFNRLLRVPDMEEIATTELVAGNNNLPSDFLAMRAIYLDDRELTGMSPVGLVSEFGTSTGLPCSYAIIGSNPRKIRLGPQPGGPTPVTLVYYKKIAGVDENNPDNWLLNEHPDLYLLGALVGGEAFIANDERLPLWRSALDEGLAELQQAGVRDQYGSAPLRPKGMAQVRGVRA